MASIHRITPCLWFGTEAEHAANLYTSVFPNSAITAVTRYGTEGFEVHQQPAGSVMVVAFDLDGQSFTALNGGPAFKFNEAVSLQVSCDTQAEIDHYWTRLGEDGDPAAQRCGWLKDKFGLSWQVVPRQIGEFFSPTVPGGAARAMAAMLPMTKLDVEALRRAYEGTA